jgi:hypothetical protein
MQQAWGRLWQKMGIRAARQAWGLAPAGQAWALVGVARHESDLWRVQVATWLTPPAGVPVVDASWLSQALSDVPRPKAGTRHRLAMGMPEQNLVAGQMTCPVDVPQETWPVEVQLEVAQALNLPPEDVNFDFEPEALGTGAVHQIRWVGCARALVVDYQRWIGAAHGWHLSCVEPEIAAARRAAQALVGGLPSLLQQAPQDWQFRLGSDKESGDLHDDGMAGVHWERVFQEALASPAGPRLVASGLALKAWT